MTLLLDLGERKLFTQLDYAGLEDVGWQLTGVPEPTAISIATGLGLVGFAIFRNRRSLKVRL